MAIRPNADDIFQTLSEAEGFNKYDPAGTAGDGRTKQTTTLSEVDGLNKRGKLISGQGTPICDFRRVRRG
jgi:hypothetical protein